jgi:hypothetical protein
MTQENDNRFGNSESNFDNLGITRVRDPHVLSDSEIYGVFKWVTQANGRRGFFQEIHEPNITLAPGSNNH